MSQHDPPAEGVSVKCCPEFENPGTIEKFVKQLRQLKAWSGLTFRDLERNAEMLGLTLPRSTLSATLSRNCLPRDRLVFSFVRACGCSPEEARRWVEIRREIAMMTTR
ncbi:helix-turn-helix transcriptional regulator [Thermopolyspora sp. NPDC052614]|uniref:helix-turn-helix domain-containing protein n=1 Tax=Thermopolyspora sp. NPDC052614 TaxID=3155682 RepID=UPI0034491BCC